MNNRQYRKKIKKIVIPHLNKIISLTKEMAEVWAVDRLPMKSVYDIIDQGKVKKISEPALDDFINTYNETLKKIKSVCKSSSDSVGDGKISPMQVELIVDVVKDSFLKELTKV